MKKVISVGTNVDKKVDNIITLISSTSDIFDGVLSYIFFNVLNMEPQTYFNTLEETGMTEKEEKKCQVNYLKFKEIKFNETLQNDITEAISFVREEALNKKYIKQYGDFYLVEKDELFTIDWILKIIYKKNRIKLKKKVEKKNEEKNLHDYL